VSFPKEKRSRCGINHPNNKENKVFRKIVFLHLTIMLLLTGCTSKPSASTPTELTKIRLPMGYIPSVQFAPFYVAADKGYYASQGLEVEFDYRFETDGVALVGANELPFALVSAEQVPLARAQGLPVVYVMSWWRDYPVAIAASTARGIQQAADLKGKKIGLPGLFGASYVGLRALLSAVGIGEDEVTLDSIGYNQVEALVSGQEDAVVIYANNEPIQLEALNFDAKIFPVKDYVALSSNGVITNEETIAENPDLVRGFIIATLQGLQDTLDDPAEAFEISKKFVENLAEADRLTQTRILTTSMDYWRSKNPGYSDPTAWDNMQKVLLEMGLLKAPLDLEKAYTNDFIPEP
jgi:NitT/TauT family transport system substrate-binding protein